MPHEVISRKEAVARGLSHYFTGQPCKNGHVELRAAQKGVCLGCARDWAQKDRASDPEKRRGYLAKWRAKNTDLNRKYARDAYHRDPEKFIERKREWSAQNPEKRREMLRSWLSKNPEKAREYKQKAYAKDPEKFLQQKREWNAANPDKVKAFSRKNYERHAPKIKKRVVEWRALNPERAREYSRAWMQNNPDAVRAANHRRRARKEQAGGSFTRQEVSKTFERQRGCCAICFKPLSKKYHADHIIPLALRGSNNIENIQLTCAPCNLRKGARDPFEYAQTALGRLL